MTKTEQQSYHDYVHGAQSAYNMHRNFEKTLASAAPWSGLVFERFIFILLSTSPPNSPYALGLRCGAFLPYFEPQQSVIASLRPIRHTAVGSYGLAGWVDAPADDMHAMYLFPSCLEMSGATKPTNAAVSVEDIEHKIAHELTTVNYMLRNSRIFQAFDAASQEKLMQYAHRIHAQRYIEAIVASRGSSAVDLAVRASLEFPPVWMRRMRGFRFEPRMYQRVNELCAWGPAEDRSQTQFRDFSGETVYLVCDLRGEANHQAREAIINRPRAASAGVSQGWGVYSDLKRMYMIGVKTPPVSPEQSEDEFEDEEDGGKEGEGEEQEDAGGSEGTGLEEEENQDDTPVSVSGDDSLPTPASSIGTAEPASKLPAASNTLGQVVRGTESTGTKRKRTQSPSALVIVIDDDTPSEVVETGKRVADSISKAGTTSPVRNVAVAVSTPAVEVETVTWASGAATDPICLD